MKDVETYFKHLPDIATRHMLAYLHDELGLVGVQQNRPSCEDNILIEDSSETAIIALGGKLPVLVALNLCQNLSRHAFDVSTAGLQIHDHEREMMAQEVVADIINVVLGQSMNELDQLNETISLSPPIVIGSGRHLHRPKNGCFSEIRVSTEQGMLKLLFIAPKSVIDLTEL